jgi:hypothetical protein
MSVGNHVTVLQLVRGTSARLGSALGRWNLIEQTGLYIYSCFRTYRSELFNRILLNQQTHELRKRGAIQVLVTLPKAGALNSKRPKHSLPRKHISRSTLSPSFVNFYRYRHEHKRNEHILFLLRNPITAARLTHPRT